MRSESGLPATKRAIGWHFKHHGIFYEGGRHEMINEINRNEVGRTCLAGFLPSCMGDLEFIAENQNYARACPRLTILQLSLATSLTTQVQ